MREEEMRKEILEKVAEYAREFHLKKQQEKDENFKEGDRVPYASRVYDEKESSFTDFGSHTGSRFVADVGVRRYDCRPVRLRAAL